MKIIIFFIKNVKLLVVFLEKLQKIETKIEVFISSKKGFISIFFYSSKKSIPSVLQKLS